MPTHDAPALPSGGLDSMLAVAVLQARGVHVEAEFLTEHCVAGLARRVRRDRGPDRAHDAARSAQAPGIRPHVIDVSEDHEPVVRVEARTLCGSAEPLHGAPLPPDGVPDAWRT